jgi:hypothetical protein
VSGTQHPDSLADYRESRAVDTPILVVEDDSQLRAIFRLLLEGEGYPVVTWWTGWRRYAPRAPCGRRW